MPAPCRTSPNVESCDYRKAAAELPHSKSLLEYEKVRSPRLDSAKRLKVEAKKENWLLRTRVSTRNCLRSHSSVNQLQRKLNLAGGSGGVADDAETAAKHCVRRQTEIHDVVWSVSRSEIYPCPLRFDEYPYRRGPFHDRPPGECSARYGAGSRTGAGAGAGRGGRGSRGRPGGNGVARPRPPGPREVRRRFCYICRVLTRSL